MPKDTSISIYSIDDLLETYSRVGTDPDEEDSVLYFISELTGMSVDAILELLYS